MKKNFFVFVLLALALMGVQAAAHRSPIIPMDENITVQEVEPFAYCCLPHKGPFTDIQNVIGQLMSTMRSQNIYPAGPLIGIYYDSPDKVKAEDMRWEMGFPVTVQAIPQPPLEKKQWIFKTVVSTVHVGPYEKAGETIEKMINWMGQQNYVPAGPFLEKYLDMDPSQAKPGELKTEIWIPCQKAAK